MPAGATEVVNALLWGYGSGLGFVLIILFVRSRRGGE